MASKKQSEKSGGDSKVIHVAFGPGGGRVDASDELQDLVQADMPPLPEPSGKEPVSDVYTQTEVGRLLSMTRGRLRSLDRIGIVSPSGRRRGRRAYTFGDIIALRAARDLLHNKVRLRDVARAIEKVRKILPTVTRPLSEVRIASDGRKVIVKSYDGHFEPLSGQMMLDFDVRELRDDVVRVLRPKAGRDRNRYAYELYTKASQLDEDPDTMDEAEALYRRALRYDPWMAIVYTNLGNIRFRRGDEAQAEQLYRNALQIDSEQSESQYNLGYMMLHRGESPVAIAFFEGAIRSDPSFADAYFNLAMAYEHEGRVIKARRCWRRYLELEPEGSWAEIARHHLNS
jgi:tetratricopeptide (TPR) repeat protein